MRDGGVRQLRLALVGFGTVARALGRLLLAERAALRADRGVDLRVTAVSTRRWGAVINPDGVDLREVLARAESGERHGPDADVVLLAGSCPADVVVETLPLEVFSGDLATRVSAAALTNGRHVVSANKGPVAHAHRRLMRMAADNAVAYRYEAAVADGLPVFNLLRHCFPGAGVTGFRGLLNSTSNVVLDAMAGGADLAGAVRSAVELGVCEADPSVDLLGWDAAVKLAALSASAWDEPVELTSIAREPVTEAVAARATAAAARGSRLVAVAEVERAAPDIGGPPAARVRLVELGPEDPFRALTGTSLGLRVTSRLICPVTIWSERPTPADTAFGLLADVLSLPRQPPGGHPSR